MMMRWRVTGVVLMSVAVFGLTATGSGVADAKSPNPSFSCWWMEPFLGLDLSPEGALFYDAGGIYDAETPDGDGTPLSKLKVIKVGSGVRITGDVGLDSISVRITKGVGSDQMSDFTTPYVGVLNGEFQGACLKHGNGTVLRDVIGVAEGDVLNVRVSPSASARIIDTIPFDGATWVYPGRANNGWRKVSVERYASRESGPITVVDGWVNGAFIA
jgi:hypothetical protein